MCKYPIGAALQSLSVSQCNPMHQGNAETCPVSELKMVLRKAYWLNVEEGHYRRTDSFPFPPTLVFVHRIIRRNISMLTPVLRDFTCGVTEVRLKYCPVDKASWHSLRVNVH